MRKISEIILHCSAVKPGQTSSARQIDEWHRRRGWRAIGYHYVIRRDGTIERGRDESDVGAYCMGHNTTSLGICYEGGLDEDGNPADTRTAAQKHSMEALLQDLLARYPQAMVYGHHHFDPGKACPCFEL